MAALGMGLPLDHRPSLVTNMINTDPPEHTRLRRACAGAFGPRRMQNLRERAQRVTDELRDAVEARGHGDLVTDLAYPLPIAIICDLLGVPESYREDVHEWSLVIDSAAPRGRPRVQSIGEVRQAARESVLRRHLSTSRRGCGQPPRSARIHPASSREIAAVDRVATARRRRSRPGLRPSPITRGLFHLPIEL
ncbi:MULTISPECIES: cytochrome P450 [Amycolatopsis]|uniref:Cytochrome P450 n=1 Tax=Amycolatopsis bullii TaxID=941987 RepID=A0ABQ3KK57_9PSEU|nr:cytochrome P450 [Amycolatopsis bullii]GHG23521.1 hypothetical protein GCM10017567_48230 [Amycolatopsis bullii]